MLLTTAGSLTLWAGAALCLLSLPPLSQAQQEFSQFSMPAESPRLPLRPAGGVKRSFFQLGCRGVYNRKVFYELETVCQDCYTVYRNPELFALCRSECFTSKYFGGCLEVVHEHGKAEQLSAKVPVISGRK